MFLATPVKFEDADSSGESNGKSRKSDIGPVAGSIAGGCVVVLLGVIGGWLFWRRRRNKKKKKLEPAELHAQETQQPQPPPSSHQPHEQKKEVPIDYTPTAAEGPEVYQYVSPVELPTPSNAYMQWELDSDERPNELHGSDAAPRAERS